MVRTIVGGIAAMIVATSSAATFGQERAGVPPPPPGAVRTIADALDALKRTKGAGSTPTGRNMQAAPIGSPSEWFSTDDYPPEAMRAHRSGRSIVRVGVDSTGQVVTCNVAISSGTDSLDRRTCAIALERGRFNPATDRKGRPIAGEYTMPIRWEIPDEPWVKDGAIELTRTPTTATAMDVTIHVSPEGIVSACHGSVSSQPVPVSAPDPCQQMPVGKVMGTRYTRNGQPVGVTLVMSRSEKVTPDP